MTPFQRSGSVRARLRAINVGTSAAALLLACMSFLIYDSFSFRLALRSRTSVLAQIVSSQVAPALDFNDPVVARQILDPLAAERDIAAAAVYDRRGRRFAHYARPEAAELPAEPGPDGERSPPGLAEVAIPVLSSGGRVGTVLLRTDLRSADERVALNAVILAAVLAVCVFLAFLFSGPFERRVTSSLTHLADTVKVVVGARDYSIRAQKERDDEIGALTEGINDMLAQIQVRDGALQLARDELEQRVEERTAQLTFVNQELQGEITDRRRAEDSLRESEQRMRILVESAPEAIVMLDGDSHRFIDVNPKAEELYGLPRSRLLEIGPVEVSPPFQPDGRPSAEAARERVREALDGGAPTFEWTHLGADGRHLTCEIHLVRLPGAGGRQIRGSIVDITKRKEVDRMKNEFVSTVSHELRTPLTSIQGSLGLIANGVTGPLPPAARPLIEIAHKNCQRLVLLINDILDSEKIAAGKMKFSFKPLDLMPLIEQAVEANKGYAAQFGVRIALAEGVAGARIEADPDRLMQVFTNLISNACKFSPRNDVVSVSVEARAGGFRISIRDRGPGIPEEFRPRIFQKFSQADSSDIRLKGGTGLGLNISKSIVEKHRGQIGFETENSRGSVFFVDLPSWHAQPAGPSRQRRLLICEDDPEVASLFRTLLTRDGFECEIANSAAAALDILERKDFDAMTLDLLLPDRDGMSLLRELRGRERTRSLPVVVVSANANEKAATLAGSSLGVADCLEKPFRADRLLAAVRRAAFQRDAKTRILHVEDDLDVRYLAALTLRDAAEVVGVGTLGDARLEIEKKPYDLVILDMQLPDGPGLDLVPWLNKPDRARIPVVLFSAQKTEKGSTSNIAAALVKSIAAHSEIPNALRCLLPAPALNGGAS